MKKNKLKWWHWLLIGIVSLLVLFGVLLGIPYLLNHFIQQPQQFEIVGEGKDWLLFWAAWLGAIASFAMVIATFISLRQNRKQVEELKRQWDEQNRPRLQFSIIAKENVYLLKISNIGKSTAFGININHNVLLFDHIDDVFKQYYPKSVFALAAGKSQYLPICYRTNNDAKLFIGKCNELHLVGNYCESYKIDEKLIVSEYMQFEVDPNFDAEMIEIKGFDKVKDSVAKNNQTGLLTIQKSLDIIAKKISEIKFENNDTK